jgi:hypothetical protein
MSEALPAASYTSIDPDVFASVQEQIENDSQVKDVGKNVALSFSSSSVSPFQNRLLKICIFL